MATVQSEKILSISHIARTTGMDRYKIATLLEHYEPLGLRVFRSPSLTFVHPESRTFLVEILERHPGVEPGLDERL